MQNAAPLAEKIHVLADRPGTAVVEVADGERRELAILNPAGTPLQLTTSTGRQISTDARAAYLDWRATDRRLLVRQAKYLELDAYRVLQRDSRSDWER